MVLVGRERGRGGSFQTSFRVENLEKFKADDGDCPTLVCTDLAARGLDLDVDHVVMFDFPKNSIDYLHRTGRTARMGAKGKVTSLIARKDVPLANRIENAIAKNESLESLSVDGIKRDAARARITEQKTTREKLVKVSNSKKNVKDEPARSSGGGREATATSTTKNKTGAKPGKGPTTFKTTKKVVRLSRTEKPSTSSRPKSATSSPKSATSRPKSPSSSKKISVVSFRGRSSLSKKETSM
ncbi:RNA helicase [Lithospermum erythrorhizon]|uniref:RNA helicase n=1 Tax=Lithospermum erythrorhizon TaxID=34254 RepID=A0AAV3QNZ4_LITER